MKNQFFDIEKRVIDLLLEYHDKLQYNCLYNIWFDFKGLFSSPTRIIMQHSGENKTELYFQEDILQKQPDELRVLQYDTYEKILSTVELIERLISEKFIAFVRNSDKKEQRRGIQGYINFAILDEEMQARIYKLSNGYFIPYRKLYVLKEHRYHTDEERKESRIQRLNLTALIISVTAAVTSVIGMFITANVKIVNDEIIHMILSMWHFPIPW